MVKKQTESEVANKIREAILASGRSRYELALAAEIEQSQLSRFLGGQNMGLPGLESLAAVLGLEIVVQAAHKPKEG